MSSWRTKRPWNGWEKLTAPFILRRLKRDVLTELPPKNESVFYTEMSEEQRKLYLAVLAQAQQKLRERDTPFLGQNKLAVLAMLTKLRQICCDPGSATPATRAAAPSWTAV